MCNGAAVSRTTYATLFETIGTTYGAGDGSNTFNLPNMGTKLISDIPNGTMPVVGNGKGLGLNAGDTSEHYLVGTYNAVNYNIVGGSNSAVGETNTPTDNHGGKTVGISTDPSKSGLVAKVNATTTTVRYYIKY
jgi:microcystin-dependent protein